MQSFDHIHIVSPRAPLPLNNAIAIDLYHFITGLHKSGLNITFHLLQEKTAGELPEGISLMHYKTKQETPRFFRRKIYSKTPLITGLLKDQAPIVFVGLHTSGIMNNIHLKNRQKIIRIHRIEKSEYRLLFKRSGRFSKRLYYKFLISLLARLEKKAAKADLMCCTSERDTKYYAKLNSNAYFLPAFHSYNKPNFMPGTGRYALYFGDLSTRDNVQAIKFLLDKVFPYLKIPVIIAGRNPTTAIKTKAKLYKHILLRADLPRKQMHDLIAYAQVAILPTFRETGLKMQFIEALFRSRHVIVNTPMVEHTGLESLCTVKNQPLAIINTVHRLFKVPFEKTVKAKRRKLFLPHYYSPDKNMQRFLSLIQKTHA